MAAPPKPLLVDIHTSVKDGDMAKVLEFLEEGGDVNVRCRYRTIPLHRAAAYNHEDIAKILLEKGADLERTPLHEAARHGHKETCALLLKRGAKRDIMDVDANEPGEDFESGVPENLRNEIQSMIENTT